MRDSEDLYGKFRREMNEVLTRNDKISSKSQRALLNELFKLERDFKATLLGSEHGSIVYRKFVEFILDDKKSGGKGNKLSIRPYFRERQDTFSDKVFKILDRCVELRDRKRNISAHSKKLHRFRINYLFVQWAVDHYRGPAKRKLGLLRDRMVEVRHMLCENNLPLALNRTALFFSKIPPSQHVQYVDLVQEAGKGLLEAIDNFVPPYRTVFRSVAIGRISLNMSENYSSTLVKLPPKDRRILYRARKAKQKNNDISGEDLQSFVNESFKGVTSSDIEMIEQAANNVVAMDAKEEGSRSMSETIADPNSLEDSVEKSEVNVKLLSCLRKLSVIERKVLLMKYGQMYGVL